MDDGRRRPVGRGMAAMLIAGQCTRHGVWRSRRPAAGRGSAPAGGLVQRGCTPHFLFHLVEKKTGRARSKRKDRFGALRCSGPPRDGGRRIGASADLARPSGTLGPSARSILPSRGGWCPGRRVARTHLTSFSFRAFRFATRSLGGRRSRCVGPCCSFHQPPASGSEKRRRVYPRLPRAHPRRRQEGCACADRPAVAFFLFGPCTARFSFCKTKREMGGASPLDMPPAGAGIPRGRRTAAPIPSTGTVPQKFSHFVKTKPVSKFSKE